MLSCFLNSSMMSSFSHSWSDKQKLATPRPTHWDVSAHRGAETGLDDSRGHAVDPDVALSQLGGQNPGQTQQGGLAHAVGAKSLQKYTRQILT